MYRSSTLLLVLSFLTGCPEEPVSILPVPAPAPVLSSGEYVLTVDGVNRWACRGINKRDVVGLEMELGLAIKGSRANAELDGLPMRGQSQPGFVYLDGSFQPEPSPVPVYEDEDVQHGGEGDDDQDSEQDSDEDGEDRGDQSADGTTKCSEADASNEGSEKCGGGGEAPDTDMAEQQSDVSIDLEVNSPRSASGIMVLNLPGCDADVNVSVKWVGKRGSRPDEPVRPDEPRQSHGGTEEGGETGGCDSDEDCG